MKRDLLASSLKNKWREYNEYFRSGKHSCIREF